jgi:predicted HAD superfamily Cof-like phosphohydrolase
MRRTSAESNAAIRDLLAALAAAETRADQAEKGDARWDEQRRDYVEQLEALDKERYEAQERVVVLEAELEAERKMGTLHASIAAGLEAERDEAREALEGVLDEPLVEKLRVALTQAENVQADVRAFHEALDIPVGDSPALRRPELRAELIREEAAETVTAIEAGDFIGAIDGLCDLLCVVYGAAVEWGIDLRPFWAEVHRTNMAKAGGPVRADGKRLKPEGWTPPNIAAVLAAAEEEPTP